MIYRIVVLLEYVGKVMLPVQYDSNSGLFQVIAADMLHMISKASISRPVPVRSAAILLSSHQVNKTNEGHRPSWQRRETQHLHTRDNLVSRKFTDNKLRSLLVLHE